MLHIPYGRGFWSLTPGMLPYFALASMNCALFQTGRKLSGLRWSILSAAPGFRNSHEEKQLRYHNFRPHPPCPKQGYSAQHAS